MKSIIHVFFLLTLLLCACGGDNGNDINSPDDQPSSDMVYFEESDEHFINPERGFYRYTETRASGYNALNLGTLTGYRSLTKSSGSTYDTYSSLIFRYFVLDEFKDREISQEFLDQVENDFSVARDAGVKVIVRFTYTIDLQGGDCNEGFICPPYGDAPKEIVLGHITQLGPVLTNNVDVIHVVQMGFIGTWGENYYTDYFGDASSNGEHGKYLDEDWSDRIEVLKALLDSTPDELMIQVRYPQMKQRYVYGIDASTSSEALTLQEAFDGSDKARIAFHNDCLFASAADFGTYEDYGNTSTPRRTDISNLKTYFADDSKYVVVGGETCFDGYSPQNDCSPAGMAVEDLRSLHYTYLNADYNNEVNNDWVDGGCMDEIRKNLGYRLVLDSALIPQEITQTSLEIKLYLRNVGFASPVKERPVHFILKSDQEEIKFTFDTDVRFWFDKTELEALFDISSIDAGEYQTVLFLPDGHESIEDKPEFALRLANRDLWQESNGYHDLGTVITIR